MINERDRAKTALHGLLIPVALVLVAVIVIQLTAIPPNADAGEENAAEEPIREAEAASEPADSAVELGTRWKIASSPPAGYRAGAARASRLPSRRGPHTETVVVSRGDTLLELLSEAGLSNNEALAVIEALGPYLSPTRLRPGQMLRFHFEQSAAAPSRIELVTAVDSSVVVHRSGESAYAEPVQRPLVTRERVVSATVVTSIYSAGRSAGLSNNHVMQLIDLLAFEVDFQREIHPGDRFRVLIEERFNRAGEYVREGELLAAEVRLRRNTIQMFRFTDTQGRSDYFDAAGTTVRKTLLRTPIDGAHISSGYGYRLHPTRGFSHLHRGIDFAARIGTPVFAAGSGRVQLRRFTRGFGNHLVLRHRNSYETVYAHLNGFARGTAAGAVVEQGQIIGYSGNTGLSTGPHLHYEVHYNGTPVNPSSLSFPPERTLSGTDRRAFQAVRDALSRILFKRDIDRPVLTR